MCGALTDEGVISKVRGAEPVAASDEGKEDDFTSLAILSEVTTRRNAGCLFSFESEGEAFHHIPSLQQKIRALPSCEEGSPTKLALCWDLLRWGLAVC